MILHALNNFAFSGFGINILEICFQHIIFLYGLLVCLIEYAQYNNFRCILYILTFLRSHFLLPGLCTCVLSAYNVLAQFCVLLVPSYSTSLASNVTSSGSPSMAVLFKEVLYVPVLCCPAESFTALVTICNYLHFSLSSYLPISRN